MRWTIAAMIGLASTLAFAQEGTLKSGSGKKVKSRKQAVAIALSEACRSGAKIPKKKARS